MADIEQFIKAALPSVKAIMNDDWDKMIEELEACSIRGLEGELSHEMLEFLKDKKRKVSTRNFRSTLPTDKDISILELELEPKTLRALQEQGVMYIGELEVIAYWHDEEMSLERKEALIDFIRSPNKNLLCYKQANVRYEVDKEGNVTNIHDEDEHKLQHINRPIQLEDIVYNPNRLSDDAYLDIDKALEQREKRL